MAITQRSALSPLPSLLSRLQTLVLELQRWQHTSAGDSKSPPLRDSTSNPSLKCGPFHVLTWKSVDSTAVGIKRSAISSPTWTVLKILQKKGFEAYLVGGCVRDLLLKKTPKDFDVITTASLKQIKKQFDRCMIVGRRFPICQVSLLNSIVEVSSFDTTQKNVEHKVTIHPSQMPKGCDKKDFIRWKDSLKRDFTINGLFYDPFVNTIYDYVDGIRDLRRSKVRTVIPAHVSFKEDCARILRGLRIAARLGLQFSKETAGAIRDLASSIMTLSKSRLMMELNFMLAYGAAESSIRLLQRFKLLEILLPVHAAYLADQTRKGFSESSIMLMKLFSNVDKLLAADRPSNCSLWVALLAFHLALVYHPQDALVVWTLSSILYHGTWSKAVPFARESSKVHAQLFPEILVPCGSKSDESLLEETSHFASLVQNSVNILTSTYVLQRLLEKHQDPSPCLDLVFVSEKMGKSVKQLFDVLATDIKSYDKGRETCKIDYEKLKKGDPHETQFVLGKIIMDTMKEEHVLTREQNHYTSVKEKIHHDNLPCEDNQNVASSKQRLLDELSHEQNPNVATVEKSCFDKLTPKQNQNVDTVETGHLHDFSSEQNQKVATVNKSHKINGLQNEKVTAVEKIHKHAGEENQKVAATKKSHKLSQKLVAVKKSHLGEITSEQNQGAIAVDKSHLDLTHEQKRNVAAAEKKRPSLSELFK